MPGLIVPFTKMNGAGNDFLVLDNRFLFFTDAELSAMAQRYCPRRTGVGADGLLALNNPTEAGTHYRMRYFNADGSRASMCGNGARCLARFARAAGIANEPLVFGSDAGIYVAEVPAAAAPVRLHVPPPRDFGERATACGPVFFLWTGTEHAVTFVPDAAAAPVATDGPAIRHDAAFAPTGANANFVEVVDPGSADTPATLRARTFEKGVEAETLACGTGALAAALVARLAGRVAADRITVLMPGGPLTVAFRFDGGALADLSLEGPAETTFTGMIEWMG